jgi:uncharacterized membrane protein YhaH (DUF805 family)
MKVFNCILQSRRYLSGYHLTVVYMFRNPFSFNGRIARTEYALSLLTYVIVLVCQAYYGGHFAKLFIIAFIPVLWFLWAQGAKRCHDINSSGWMQIVPFYFLWLLFASGDKGTNQYGPSPKNTLKHNEFTLD